MDDILGIRDLESADAVRRMFNAFGLPVPERGEYWERWNKQGPLILVSRYGFVIRIVPEDKVVDIKNPHFIKPLFNRAAGNYRFGIDPGYELALLDEDQRSNLKALINKKYGVFCHDMKSSNIARVPGHPDHLALIDLDKSYMVVSLFSVAQLTRAAKAIAKRLGITGPEYDPQLSLYKPLRDILERAWPDGAPDPDPEGIRAFKEMCLQFKAEGRLRSDWEDPEHDYMGTWHIARAYDDHLKDYETFYDQRNPQPLRLTA